jgi:CrcB protein
VILAAVMLAGAAGAVARYILDFAISSRRSGSLFPWGTFVINVTGSLALGILTGLALHHGLSPLGRTIVGTGFLGGYTTFSTFTYETLRLIEDGARGPALGNALGSVTAGMAAASLGLMLGGL